MARYDVDYVKQSAKGRWSQLLPQFGIPAELLDGKHHPCPKCGGQDRFRLIDEDEGACLCNQCFADKNGDGIAAIQWSKGIKFMDAVQLVADQLGIEPEAKGKASSRKIDPAKNLHFLEWNDTIVGLWCIDHPPITPDGLKQIGARCAKFRGAYNVIAVPIWGPQLRDAQPVGWVILCRGGAPVYTSGPKQPPELKTKFNTGGSKQGLIVAETFGQAKEVWKTEGPTDLAALLSTELPEGVSACCNAMGAGEKPLPWMVKLFADKSVCVVHDSDVPGQRGALLKEGGKLVGWAPAIAAAATECRNVQLPYAISKDKGNDLRDFLAAGNGYQQLQTLVAKADPVEANRNALLVEPNLAPDDPVRLARVNLDRYACEREGGTLRCWRDEFYKWNGKSYRKISRSDLRAKLTRTIQDEFEQLSVLEQQESGDEPKYAKKVTQALINNVLNATASLTLIPESVELLTWVEDDLRERRNIVAMENGLLDLDGLLSGDEDCLKPHTPSWFSTISLPYSFDPDADCPRWKAFLRRNLGGDPSLEQVLQEWAGYLLLPDTGFQKFLVLEGEGANGKSVYMAAIRAMLGSENCSHIPLELFGDRFAKTQTLGKLVNISADVGEMDKVAEGYLKSFTAGDVMYFDRKGIDGIDCVPTARLMLACNNRPRFSDKSRGLWRRMLLVPLRIEIPETERITHMDQSWWWEQSDELPGILNWAIKGLHRLSTRQEFTEPEVSLDAIEDYQDETNPARRFLREHVCLDHDGRVECPDLYAAYKSWCRESGHHHMADGQFGKEVRRVFKGVERRRGRRVNEKQERVRVWYYQGVSFNPNGVPSDAEEAMSDEEWS